MREETDPFQRELGEIAQRMAMDRAEPRDQTVPREIRDGIGQWRPSESLADERRQVINLMARTCGEWSEYEDVEDFVDAFRYLEARLIVVDTRIVAEWAEGDDS